MALLQLVTDCGVVLSGQDGVVDGVALYIVTLLLEGDDFVPAHVAFEFVGVAGDYGKSCFEAVLVKDGQSVGVLGLPTVVKNYTDHPLPLLGYVEVIVVVFRDRERLIYGWLQLQIIKNKRSRYERG